MAWTTISRFVAILLTLWSALALTGCGAGEEADSDSGAKAAVTPDPAMLTALAGADAVDGETDKVVSKCLMCGLGMSGNANHPSTVGDYTLHHCSSRCQAKFDEDPKTYLVNAKIPE